MGLSFGKRMSLSKRILVTTEEALELQARYKDLLTQLIDIFEELDKSTKQLLALHKELTSDAKVPDEIEVTDDSHLQVVTTHGTYVIGSSCPKHQKVHYLGGWYICVDDGLVNVTGWHPNVKGGT